MNQKSDQTATTPPSVQPKNNPSDPLNQLEELINQAKNNAGGSSVSSTSPTDENSDSEEDVQKKMEQINRLKQQRAKEEEKLIVQQRELMEKTVAESPQTNKRAEAKREESLQNELSTDGLEIRQLSHIKIKRPIKD